VKKSGEGKREDKVGKCNEEWEMAGRDEEYES
jgi:hypothetical protein